VDTEDVRLAVYRSFAVTGHAPDPATLDGGVLRELHEQRHVVLGPDGRIVMAHPFTAVPLGFSVMGRATLWWGGCAWDSFALPHLLPDEGDVLVATRCPGCDAALAWVVGRETPPGGDEVAHFLVPAARMWDDVVHTCGHQRLFCGEACVAAWLRRTGHERGYVMDLATLWRLARGWYAGRLERGYQRREPSEARDYFRSVGLSGPFWGL
jgi:alkylmercury lyase-like protein